MPQNQSINSIPVHLGILHAPTKQSHTRISHTSRRKYPGSPDTSTLTPPAPFAAPPHHPLLHYCPQKHHHAAQVSPHPAPTLDESFLALHVCPGCCWQKVPLECPRPDKQRFGQSWLMLMSVTLHKVHAHAHTQRDKRTAEERERKEQKGKRRARCIKIRIS